MAVIKLPIPPMRDVFIGPKDSRNTDQNTGITFPWVRWFQQLIDTLNQFVAAITGNTILSSTQANLAGIGLGPENAGQLVWVTDYNHLLVWNGTGFDWGPGENGSGYISPFLTAPSGSGWKLCDGSSTTRLNSNGTITAVVVPNYASSPYLKMGTGAAAGPIAASGLVQAVSAGTPSGAVAIGDDDTNVEVQAGVGTTVAADPHQHPATFIGNVLPTHVHGPGTMELNRTQLLGYYRR